MTHHSAKSTRSSNNQATELGPTVCIVTHCYPLFEGDLYGNFLPEVADHLERLSCRVLVLTPDMRGAGRRRADHRMTTYRWLGGDKRLVELKLSNPLHLLAIVSLFAMGTVSLVRLCRREDVDFCLAPWAIPNGFICWMARWLTGTPFGVWALGSDINEYGAKPLVRDALRLLLRRSDLLFANSRELLQQVRQYARRQPALLATNRTLPTENLEPPALRGDHPQLLFVGRFERAKGIDLLLDATADLAARGRMFDLHLLGDGSLRHLIEKRIDEAGLSGRVFLHGLVDGRTVAAFLRAVDLLVIPSRSEGLPVIFHEAVQMECPLVVTPIGELAEYCVRYGVGIAATEVSAAGIAHAIDRALDSGERMAYTAPDELKQMFDLGHAIEGLAARIRPILSWHAK